jgi:hypothetical protein
MADREEGHGMPVRQCDGCTAYLPHASVARMALEVLFDVLAGGEDEPPQEAKEGLYKAMWDYHDLLWRKKMQEVADSGLTPHYLIIRPVNPLNMPPAQAAAEIRDAVAALVRHGMIAGRGGDD